MSVSFLDKDGLIRVIENIRKEYQTLSEIEIEKIWNSENLKLYFGKYDSTTGNTNLDIKYELDEINYKTKFYTNIETINSGFYTNEWGILISTETDDFDIYSSGIKKIQDVDSNVINSNYAGSAITLNGNKPFINHLLVRCKIYAILSKNSSTTVIYSDLLKIQF